ncbi:MAG: hypothetical protein HOQ20_10820 [Bradyrhizobium sp.]|nr:hypothetical protein [Bradyrhizobium sp.]
MKTLIADLPFSSVVIMIGGRFFYELKNGRVMTAWCLAGAKHYQAHPLGYEHEKSWEPDFATLVSRGKKPVVVPVFCMPPETNRLAGAYGRPGEVEQRLAEWNSRPSF